MVTSPKPLRSPFVRLLASVLVVASLLGNGLALAQAPSALADKGCCPQPMGATVMHKAGCNEAGQPCPAPSTGCDVQCRLGCQSAPAVPGIALLLPAIVGVVALPTHASNDRPLTDSGPGLRPPISA